MKKKIADMWVAALRSGKYEQGRKKLKTRNNKFCCLGVLCDISNIGKWSNEGTYVTGPMSGSNLVLPTKVQKWAGTNSCSPYYFDNVNYSAFLLATLNDEKGKSFAEIADIIEKNYKAL